MNETEAIKGDPLDHAGRSRTGAGDIKEPEEFYGSRLADAHLRFAAPALRDERSMAEDDLFAFSPDIMHDAARVRAAVDGYRRAGCPSLNDLCRAAAAKALGQGCALEEGVSFDDTWRLARFLGFTTAPEPGDAESEPHARLDGLAEQLRALAKRCAALDAETMRRVVARWREGAALPQPGGVPIAATPEEVAKAILRDEFGALRLPSRSSHLVSIRARMKADFLRNLRDEKGDLVAFGRLAAPRPKAGPRSPIPLIELQDLTPDWTRSELRGEGYRYVDVRIYSVEDCGADAEPGSHAGKRKGEGDAIRFLLKQPREWFEDRDEAGRPGKEKARAAVLAQFSHSGVTKRGFDDRVWPAVVEKYSDLTTPGPRRKARPGAD